MIETVRYYFQYKQKMPFTARIPVRKYIMGLVGKPRSLSNFQQVMADAEANIRLQAQLERIRPGEPVIVAEGDSWFNFPFYINDPIDHLHKNWIILCTSMAGEPLRTIVEDHDHINMITRHQPHIVMLSGGGNDMLGIDVEGNSILALIVRGRGHHKTAREIINREILEEYANYYEQYVRQFCEAIWKARRETVILVHGYDHPRPSPTGKLIGRVLRREGITDPLLWSEITAAIIDIMNEKLLKLSDEFDPRLWAIDLRGTVPREPHYWFDEIHPNSDGFKPVAEKFDQKLKEIVESGLAGRFEPT